MWDFLVSKPKHYTSEDVHGAVIASTLAILERIKTNVEKASLPVNVSKEKELLESLGLTSSKSDSHNTVDTSDKIQHIIKF